MLTSENGYSTFPAAAGDALANVDGVRIASSIRSDNAVAFGEEIGVMGLDHDADETFNVFLVGGSELTPGALSGNQAIVRESFADAGRVSVAAALTTAAAFGCLALSDFRAFREFGALIAAGMVLVLASYLTLMPALIGLLTAYLLTRQRFAGRGALEFATMLSFAIPGTVLGVAHILAFNVPPVEITGTGLILVIAFVFRNMPVGVRSGIAGLSQIDKSLDEASATRSARSFTTLWRVVLPLLRPALVAALVYSFVRSMTTVSAVIFLVTAETELATTFIIGRVGQGDYGVALAYSTVLIVTMALATAMIQWVVGDRKLGRRGVAAQA